MVILFVGAITLFFLWHLPNLSFRTSIYDLIIEDLPETIRYREFKSIFGSDEIIRIVIRAQNIFDPLTFQKIEHLSNSAAKINGIRRVISLPSIKSDVEAGKKWRLEEFQELVAPIKLFDKNLLSADQSATVLTLVLATDADKEYVIQSIRRLFDSATKALSLYQIGMPLVSQALVRYTEMDFLRLTPITLLIVTVVLFIIFRNYKYLFIPLICVTLTLIWTFGLMAFVRIPISMLTLIVPVFLIAVGTAYCLHIMCEYLSNAHHADSPTEAVLSTFSHTALPTVLAVLTTSIGLGSLLINRITAIHEFALFSCFGMLSLLFILLTLFPATLVFVPLPDKGDLSFKKTGFLNRFLNKIVYLDLKHQRLTFLIIAAITLFCGTGLLFLQVETNPVGFFKDDTTVSRNFHDIHRDLSGSFPVHVVMDGQDTDTFESPRHIAELARFQNFLEILPGVDKTVSFADYMKLVNYVLNKYDPKYYVLPQEGFEVRMLINNYKTLLGDDMLLRFMNPEFSKANILLLTHLSSSREFLRTKEKVLAHASRSFSDHYNWDVTGFGIAVAASSDLLVRGQAKSFSITIGLIFCIMIFLFLSAKVGFIAIIPNCFPIIINFGLMGWLGIDLSVATSLIASIAIGLAVDDTIHYLVRYNREFKKDLDKDRALRDTLLGVGKPIIFTTLCITLGFSILLFSQFKPTAVFGFLMVITLLAAFVGDLILLPSLMLHVELVTAWDLLKLMPSVGGMPAGTVHEMNQPLNAIKMGSEFIKMMIQRGKPIHTDQLSQVAHEISGQVDRISEMINRLKAIGMKPDLVIKKININDHIRNIVAVLGPQLNLDNIDLKLELDETVPLIPGHPNRFEQVIYNLITNAWDAVNAMQTTGDAPLPRMIIIRTAHENKRVSVSVSDSGIGIPHHLKERILEPFFTSKESGTGKGLGLSICRQIVKDFGGRIHVKSHKGKGSTFKLAFPVNR